MKMPAPDEAVLAKRAEIIGALKRIAPDGVISAESELKVFESDGLTAYRQPPMIAVLPRTADEVAKVLALCGKLGVKVVPRGAGTSLSGGALPLADGVLLGLSRLNQIVEIDVENACVVA